MADQKYQVIFYGKIKPGADIESVKNNLAQVFRLDEKKVEALFSGKKKVIKKEADRALCQKTKRVFDAAGAVVTIVPLTNGEAPPPEKDEPESGPAESKPVPPPLPVQTGSGSAGVAPETIPPANPAGPGRISKPVLLLLTAFLGGFGVHKFYLSKNIQGIVYFLFSWTLVPGLIALVEFIRYAVTDEETLNERYQSGSMPLVIIMGVCGPFFFLMIFGIILAIAIPLIVSSHQKAIFSSTMNLIPRLPDVTRSADAATTDTARVTCCGKIKGLDFAVGQAWLENGVLHLTSGDSSCSEREMLIFMFGKDRRLSGRRIKVSPDSDHFSDPQIHLRWSDPTGGLPHSEVALKGYDLNLEFGRVLGHRVEGKIDLNIPGEPETRVAGTFTAQVAD